MKRKNQSKSKKQPTYSLQECKRLANMGRLKIPERVNLHMEAINDNVPYSFTIEIIPSFINSLTENDFSKSILYEGKEIWFDVYIKKYDFYYYDAYWDKREKASLTLYFKYFIQDEKLFVQVVSFHPER